MGRNFLSQRHSIRLRGFDYTRSRAYFVTICAMQKLCLFGEVRNGIIELSQIGEVVSCAWQDLPNHADDLSLDAWVVMPNHLHGIVTLPGRATAATPIEAVHPRRLPGSLGTVIGGFKSAVSREVNARNLTFVRPIWQRNYYERIIRDDRELNATRRYILDNPLRWDDDPEHPRHHPIPGLSPRL